MAKSNKSFQEAITVLESIKGDVAYDYSKLIFEIARSNPQAIVSAAKTLRNASFVPANDNMWNGKVDSRTLRELQELVCRRPGHLESIKVTAIKLYRARTGAGLAEAKIDIEAMAAYYGWTFN